MWTSIVGAAETTRLSIWNIKRVIEEFRALGLPDDVSFGSDSDSEESRSEEENEELEQEDNKAPKKRKRTAHDFGRCEGAAPTPIQIVDIPEAKYTKGGIQSIGDTHMLVAGLVTTTNLFQGAVLFDSLTLKERRCLAYFVALPSTRRLESNTASSVAIQSSLLILMTCMVGI
jgi:hypothetical protein